MIKLIEEAASCAQQSPQRVVFPDALDKRILQAAYYLLEKGYANPILLANPFQMRHYCHQNQIKCDALTVIDPAHSPLLGSFTNKAQLLWPDWPLEILTAQLSDPLWFGAMMLTQNEADLCIGGNLSSTAHFLKAAIKIVGLKKNIRTVSSIFFMVPPDTNGVFGFADCVVVPSPTAEQLADIAIATAESFQNFTGQTPKVALLSFSTKGSAKHPLVKIVQEATQLTKSRSPGLLVDGELQFDAAFVPEVAAQKTENSPLKGEANIFIFPDLACGNIAYKIAQRMANYDAIGPIIQGLQYPMHDLSRGCSTEDIIQTVLVAIKMAKSCAN